ncbi:hypothetical protein NE237_028594 [Protea cynaroides]|uniref:Uncharacterized protein n=1 Tax=Protea cynaroides TaxID=273540 RepID=A0A9Q0GTK2_9MAGN|nr:hypothetical protein NE237_028594 [Protea cynaroides]
MISIDDETIQPKPNSSKYKVNDVPNPPANSKSSLTWLCKLLHYLFRERLVGRVEECAEQYTCAERVFSKGSEGLGGWGIKCFVKNGYSGTSSFGHGTFSAIMTFLDKDERVYYHSSLLKYRG